MSTYHYCIQYPQYDEELRATDRTFSHDGFIDLSDEQIREGYFHVKGLIIQDASVGIASSSPHEIIITSLTKIL